MSAQPNEATLKQIKAARPQRSTWLSANAGSGKTRVLTDRVARLLLEGVDPQNILCLTYTKAAASEMQNRLLDRLGAWAMKPDEKLQKELTELGALTSPDPAFYATARRLFAKAIETPGGLRIQTIHSFCASLLRRFPLEAGVTPQFTEMDDRSAAQLRAQVADEMADSDEAHLLSNILQHLGGNDFEEFTAGIVSNKAQFASELSPARALSTFSLPENADETILPKLAFSGDEITLFEALADAAKGTTKTYINFTSDVLAILNQPHDVATVKALYDHFLYKSDHKEKIYYAWDSKSRNYPQSNHDKAVEAFAPYIDELHAFMDRVHEAKMAEFALAAVEAALALNRFARAFLRRYETAKAHKGWLDFDDFITKASALLTEPQVAQWVLYRLDGGIDHILVDEAQDTSPTQWAVIEELAREITAGMGAERDTARTIFVVGDRKQSIYSFQGADSAEFGRMQQAFAERLENHDEPLVIETLKYSFRSSTAVLGLVDAVFANRGNSGFQSGEDHIAFHADMPGRVDLWTPIPPSEKEPDKPWFEPVDILAPDDPVVMLAESIAAHIRRTIDAGTLLPTKRKDDGTWNARPVHEGDYLILLQRRSALFHEIIRACKAKGLDVAGADRLKIGEEIAVKDITALLRFLATQEDDLSLAAALRSPLFGWSEQELYTLAEGRKGYLWEALRAETETHSKTLAILDDMRSVTDFLRPYELIERILVRHGGRQKILTRLGYEAEDAVDAFLEQALHYERSGVPSLTGFLSWLESDDPEVKRQIEAGGKRIRVMTVHGSKGLEAPIVILPDTANRPNDFRGQIVTSGEKALFARPKAERPPALDAAMQAKLDAEEAERERLLYVAMTRAEKWLIIAAAGKVEKETSWFNIVSNAAENLDFVPHSEGSISVQRLEHGDWENLQSEKALPNTSGDAQLESHFLTPAPTPAAAERTISASKLPGAKALGGEAGLDEASAMRYGTKLHLLLEHLPGLPKEERAEAANALLGPMGDNAENAAILAETETVLASVALNHVFADNVLSEVALTAPSAALGRPLSGIIDKLVVTDQTVTAIDIKSNATLPDTPEQTPLGILRQMGAYAEALAQIYPDREIRTAILWTKGPILMPLPHDLVMKALEDTTYLDAPPDAP